MLGVGGAEGEKPSATRFGINLVQSEKLKSISFDLCSLPKLSTRMIFPLKLSPLVTIGGFIQKFIERWAVSFEAME